MAFKRSGVRLPLAPPISSQPTQRHHTHRNTCLARRASKTRLADPRLAGGRTQSHIRNAPGSTEPGWGRPSGAPQSRFCEDFAMSRVPTLSSPFLLGFEEIGRALDRVAKAADGYPPYNVERVPAAHTPPGAVFTYTSPSG